MSAFNQKSETSGSEATSAPKERRKRSAGEKQRMVKASFKPGASVRAVAEAHGLHPSQLYKWRRLYRRKLEGNTAAKLLPVRVAEKSIAHGPHASMSSSIESEAARPATIHVEFTHARVRIESADHATLLAVLEHLAR